MAESLTFNMDCMEAMKRFPDKYFDLAVVDPPYGDACSQNGNVERERERAEAVEQVRRSVRQVQDGADTDRARTVGSRTEHGVMRTGGTWAAKYAKKLLRGMLRRSKSILRSCFASHEIRLYGGAITSRCRRQDVF